MKFFFEEEQKLRRDIIKYIHPVADKINKIQNDIYEQIAYWPERKRMKIYTLLYPTGLLDEHEICNNIGLPIATTFMGEAIEVTDGYHTMTELYNHRNRLYIALCKFIDRLTLIDSKYTVIKSKKHFDESMYEEGNFIVVISIKKLKGPDEQISYHLPLELWDDCPFLELPTSPESDGHSSDDVLERLRKL